MVAALTTNTDQYLMSDDTVMATTTACQTQQNMRGLTRSNMGHSGRQDSHASGRRSAP